MLVLLDYDTSQSIFTFCWVLHNNWNDLFILEIMRHIWFLWKIIWNLYIHILSLICILNVVILCDIINYRLDDHRLLNFRGLIYLLYLLLRRLRLICLLRLLLYYRYNRFSKLYKMLVYVVDI